MYQFTEGAPTQYKRLTSRNMELNTSPHLHFDHISPVQSLSHHSCRVYYNRPDKLWIPVETDQQKCQVNVGVIILSLSDVMSKAPCFTSYGSFTLYGTGTWGGTGHK